MERSVQSNYKPNQEIMKHLIILKWARITLTVTLVIITIILLAYGVHKLIVGIYDCFVNM